MFENANCRHWSVEIKYINSYRLRAKSKAAPVWLCNSMVAKCVKEEQLIQSWIWVIYCNTTLKGRRAEPHSCHTSIKIGKPCVWVLMVIVVSGMARGRVRSTYLHTYVRSRATWRPYGQVKTLTPLTSSNLNLLLITILQSDPRLNELLTYLISLSSFLFNHVQPSF